MTDTQTLLASVPTDLWIGGEQVPATGGKTVPGPQSRRPARYSSRWPTRRRRTVSGRSMTPRQAQARLGMRRRLASVPRYSAGPGNWSSSAATTSRC